MPLVETHSVILPCHLVVLSALVVVLSVVVIFEHWELGLLLPFKYELVGCLLCDCMRGVSVTVPSFLPIWANFFFCMGLPITLNLVQTAKVKKHLVHGHQDVLESGTLDFGGQRVSCVCVNYGVKVPSILSCFICIICLFVLSPCPLDLFFMIMDEAAPNSRIMRRNSKQGIEFTECNRDMRIFLLHVAITATEHQVDREYQNNEIHEDDEKRENKDTNLSKI